MRDTLERLKKAIQAAKKAPIMSKIGAVETAVDIQAELNEELIKAIEALSDLNGELIDVIESLLVKLGAKSEQAKKP